MLGQLRLGCSSLTVHSQVAQHALPRPGEHLDLHNLTCSEVQGWGSFWGLVHTRWCLAWRRSRITQERPHQKLSWAQYLRSRFSTWLSQSLHPRELPEPWLDTMLLFIGRETSICLSSQINLPVILQTNLINYILQKIVHLIIPKNKPFCVYWNIFTSLQWQT